MTDATEVTATTAQKKNLAKLHGVLPGGLQAHQLAGENTLVKNGWASYDGERWYKITDTGLAQIRD